MCTIWYPFDEGFIIFHFIAWIRHLGIMCSELNGPDSFVSCSLSIVDPVVSWSATMSRRPVNPSRRPQENAGASFASSLHQKSRSSPLLSVGLILGVYFHISSIFLNENFLLRIMVFRTSSVLFSTFRAFFSFPGTCIAGQVCDRTPTMSIWKTRVRDFLYTLQINALFFSILFKKLDVNFPSIIW